MKLGNYISLFVNHLNMLLELKQKFKQDPAKEPVSTTVTNHSQSITHLRALFGNQFDRLSLDNRVEQALRASSKIHKHSLSNNELQRLKGKCLDFLQFESEHPDKIFFYHAVNNKIAFVYDLYSRLYQLMTINSRWQAFRINHPLFSRLLNITQFIQHFEKNGVVSDYSQDSQSELALSTNLALFGSLNWEFSSSMTIFLNNKMIKEVDLQELLQRMLPFGPSDALLSKLNEAFKQCHPKNRGVLYQIAAPRHVADQYAYMAKAGGAVYPYKGSHLPSMVLQSIEKDMLGADQKEAEEYLLNYQARLMVPPHVYFDVNSIQAKDLSNETYPTLSDYSSLINELIGALFSQLQDDTISTSVPAMRLLTAYCAHNNITLYSDNIFRRIEGAFVGMNFKVARVLAKQSRLTLKFLMYLYVEADCIEHAKKLADEFNFLLDEQLHPVRKTAAQMLVDKFSSDIFANAKAVKHLITLYGEEWPHTIPSPVRFTLPAMLAACAASTQGFYYFGSRACGMNWEAGGHPDLYYELVQTFKPITDTAIDFIIQGMTTNAVLHFAVLAFHMLNVEESEFTHQNLLDALICYFRKHGLAEFSHYLPSQLNKQIDAFSIIMQNLNDLETPDFFELKNINEAIHPFLLGLYHPDVRKQMLSNNKAVATFLDRYPESWRHFVQEVIIDENSQGQRMLPPKRLDSMPSDHDRSVKKRRVWIV